jgi:Flp pilus assembly protein TadD
MFSLSLSSRSYLLRRFTIFIGLATLLLIPVQVASAQGGGDLGGTGGRHSIQGRIYFPSGRRVDTTIQVKLQSFVYPEITVFADSNGSFSFKSLAPASYTVVIDAGSEYEIARESVIIDGDVSSSRTGVALPAVPRRYSILVHLQPKLRQTVKPGTINAKLAEVPAEARAQYEKGLEAGRTGDSKEAVKFLKSAIAQYPKFPLALNELGLQYLKLGDASSAVDAFHSAVDFAPDEFTPRLNYGIALLQSKNFSLAESQLSEALKKNATSPTAYLYLGIARINLKNFDDAETTLLKAVDLGGDSVNLARYYLGGIYWYKKEYKRAADELEQYLKHAPNAADSERIKSTIKDLRRRS